MADHIPDWAQEPKQKGFVVEARHPDGKNGKVDLDDRAGVLFGRNGQVCNCEVAHKSASRVHACLAYDGEIFQIEDLASSHGTFVDGERLEKSGRAHVVPGKTVITIGRCPIEYILLLSSVNNHEGEVNVHRSRHLDNPAGDSEGVPKLDQRRNNGSLEVRRDGYVREHHDRNTAGPEARSGDHGHEHHSEALAHRQRVPTREQAPRGNADARPSDRDGCREEIRPRRPSERSYRGVGHRDGPRDGCRGRDSYVRHDAQHGRARDGGKEPYHHGSGRGRHAASDSRRYDQPDRRDDRRRSERSPKAQRRRTDAESEGEDKVLERAAEERRRKRKSAFDDAPAPGPVSTHQQTPAQIVMGMMGGGGMPTGMLNAEQKKKLLWGKKAEPVEAAPVEAFGANRWDTAEFTNESEKEKFIKLMGVKKVPTVPTAAMAQAQPASPTEREALTREKQDRLLHNVEAQFMAGLRRADGRTVGLGL